MNDRMIFPFIVIGILIGVIATVLVLIGVEVQPEQLEVISLEYTDLISITLTSLSVIITALAICIGILALWGYSQFVKITQNASAAHVEKLMNTDAFSERINEIIVANVSKELDGGKLEAIVKKNVEAILLNDAEVRAKSNVADGEEFSD